MGGGAFTMALAQEAEHREHLRVCWLARERLRVSEARSDVTAEVAEVSAAEAAAADAAAAVEGVAAVEAAATIESAAAAGAAAKAAADAPGAEAALAPELDLAEMLGHKGESYSQEIVELGFQLIAMRLASEKAVNVTVNVWLQSRSLPARGRVDLEVHRCLCIIDAPDSATKHSQ
jgi:hypothetical protein